MCLYSREPVHRIALKNIECFKVLKKENGQWITPFWDFPISFNKEIKTEIPNTPVKEIFGRYEISEGYFHVCETENSAKSIKANIEVAYSREKMKCPELKIFKAIIPKDSLYYVGVRDDYCSDKLIILSE